MDTTTNPDLRFIRRWLVFFMAAMVFSGITAVPLEWGSRLMADVTASWGGPWPSWTSTVAAAIADIGQQCPMIFYGSVGKQQGLPHSWEALSIYQRSIALGRDHGWHCLDQSVQR
jgi:hypothetical protein